MLNKGKKPISLINLNPGKNPCEIINAHKKACPEHKQWSKLHA